MKKQTFEKITWGLVIFLAFMLVGIKCFADEFLYFDKNLAPLTQNQGESIRQVYNNRGPYKKDIAITILHDDIRSVTCYVAQNPRGEELSISCLKG